MSLGQRRPRPGDRPARPGAREGWRNSRMRTADGGEPWPSGPVRGKGGAGRHCCRFVHVPGGGMRERIAGRARMGAGSVWRYPAADYEKGLQANRRLLNRIKSHTARRRCAATTSRADGTRRPSASRRSKQGGGRAPDDAGADLRGGLSTVLAFGPDARRRPRCGRSRAAAGDRCRLRRHRPRTPPVIPRLRIKDGVVRRMIDKWLSGRGARRGEPPLGGVISPLLSNVFLHHVLDVWFERVAKPRRAAACGVRRRCPLKTISAAAHACRAGEARAHAPQDQDALCRLPVQASARAAPDNRGHDVRLPRLHPCPSETR